MKTIEINYVQYKVVVEGCIEISKLMVDISKLTVFEKQKIFPKKLDESKLQITQLNKDIIKGCEFPAIVILVNNEKKLINIIDGMHRIIAYNQMGVKRCRAILVRR